MSTKDHAREASIFPMIQPLLASNWQLFDSINDHAGTNHVLDGLMIFGASDLIFGMGVIVALWWLAFVSWSPVRGWMRGLSEADRRFGMRTLIMIGAAAVLAVACNLAIERFLFEPRPFISHPNDDILLISHAADGSFPSDHAAVATAITMMVLLFLALLVRRQTRSRGEAERHTLTEWGAAAVQTARSRYALVAAFAIICVVALLWIGYARIFVGVHYPLDILGGVGTGSLSACFATWLGGRLTAPLDRLVALLARIKLA
jgi:undecaprenyl-diphosphatase